MREKEKTRVIWRHPQGRFEIQETEHYSLFDTAHTTRANAYLRRRTMRAAVQRGADSHLCAGGNQAGGSVAAARDGRGKTAACENVSSSMPIRAISRETGRACDTISNVLEELGCRKKKLHKSVHWTYEEFQKAVAMRKRGYLYKEIGAALGKSDHAVQNKFAREGY